MKNKIPFKYYLQAAAIYFGVLLAAGFITNALAYSPKRPIPPPTAPISSPSVYPTATVNAPLIPGQDEDRGFSYVCQGCTAAEKVTLSKVQELIKKFIASKCFDDAWWGFDRIEQDDVGTGKLGKSGIIYTIRKASIKNIPVEFYWPRWNQSKSVIGWTSESDPVIHLNRSFRARSSWTDWAEASNLFHETLHKVGFDHDYKATSRRPYSVPYLGNRAVELCEGKI